MKASERLRATAGSNIAESVSTSRPAPQAVIHAPSGNRYEGTDRIKGAMSVPLDRIVPDPDQPRREFDPGEIARLARSLADRGQLQPARVRWDQGRGVWVIVAGERRYRAALEAGLPSLQCVEEHAAKSPGEILDDQLTENLVREDLKPVEQARAFRAVMEGRGWTQRQIADHLHVSQSRVAKALSLLDLDPSVQEEVDAGSIPAATAHEIARIPDPARQADLAELARAGMVKRSEVRAEAARKPRPVEFSWKIDGHGVTVRMTSDSPGEHDALRVLRAAVRLLEKKLGPAKGAA